MNHCLHTVCVISYLIYQVEGVHIGFCKVHGESTHQTSNRIYSLVVTMSAVTRHGVLTG